LDGENGSDASDEEEDLKGRYQGEIDKAGGDL
jgi:hypothetical protein